MRRRMRGRRALVLVGALAAALAPGRALAAWWIETRQVEADGRESRGRIVLADDRLRLEFADPSERQGILIFRADPERLVQVDPAARRYVEIDRATADRMGSEAEAARRQMEASMAGLPAAQRETLQRMMGGAVPAARAPRTLVSTPRTREVDGQTCRVREWRRDDRVEGELCLVSWQEAGIARSDLEVFRSLAAFQRRWLGAMAGPFARGLDEQPFDVFEDLDGYPVESREIEDGRTTRTTRFSTPRKADAAPELFEPPAGFERAAMGTP